jgi:hypothetical protein
VLWETAFATLEEPRKFGGWLDKKIAVAALLPKIARDGIFMEFNEREEYL